MAKRGELVALQTWRNTYFIGSPQGSMPGYRTESREEWTLVRVAAATKHGTVKSIRYLDRGYDSQLKHMAGNPRVHTLASKQAEAERLAAMGTAQFDSADTLKAAILAA